MSTIPKTLMVRIEIAAGSTVKYEWCDKRQSLVVDRFVRIPYPDAYGFAEHTLSEDGDALDVFVVCESQAFLPGSLVEVVPTGHIMMTDDGERDPKVIAIPRCEWDPAGPYSTELPADLRAALITRPAHRIQKFLRNYKQGVVILPDVSSVHEIIADAEARFSASHKDLLEARP